MSELTQIAKKYWFPFILCMITLTIFDYSFGTVCYSVILFGIPCPACGITRATKLLLTGHIRESFQMHPLLILVILGVILYLFLNILLKKYVVFINYYVIICIFIFVCFYIYRMKMYYPNVEPMLYQKDNFISKVLSLLYYGS